MNKEVFVRIVILNYNESQYTIDLVTQLEKQNFRNFEIIVVDNASRKEERQKLKDNLPEKITKIFSEKNLGYAKGNNLGLKYPSPGTIDYHLVLNNDLIIDDENFITTMIDGMKKHRDSNVVASSPFVDMVLLDIPLGEKLQVRRILSAWDFFMLSTPIFTPFIKKKSDFFHYKEKMPITNQYLLCDSINGAAFMIQDQFLKENNYLDEGTFLYFEEIILGKQIITKGKKCLLNGFTHVQHLQGVSTKSTGVSINPKMERYKYESALYYLKKYENLGFFGQKLFILLNEVSILLKKIIK